MPFCLLLSLFRCISGNAFHYKRNKKIYQEAKQKPCGILTAFFPFALDIFPPSWYIVREGMKLSWAQKRPPVSRKSFSRGGHKENMYVLKAYRFPEGRQRAFLFYDFGGMKP